MNDELRLLLPVLESFVRLRMGRALAARECSEDIAQSACREVLQALNSRPALEAFELRRWLFRAAERKILERARYWRAAKRDPAREIQVSASNAAAWSEHAVQFLFSLSPSQDVAAREEIRLIVQSIQRLPSIYRVAILYSHLGGFTIEALAQELNRTPAATRTLLSRARSRLASMLAESDD